MSENEIKPALSAEQWADVASGKLRFPVPGIFEFEHRHGTAAVYLYRQPYGFTHEDVALVRAMALFAEHSDNYGAEAEPLYELAAKIAALLPLTP